MYYLLFIESTRLYSFKLFSIHNLSLLLRFFNPTILISFAASYHLWECEALSSEYWRLLNWWGVPIIFDNFVWWVTWRTISCVLAKLRDINRVNWSRIDHKIRKKRCPVVTVIFFVKSIFASSSGWKCTI
jgi:hypothetical protein